MINFPNNIMKKQNTKIVLGAIIAITTLEITALLCGVNGTLLSLSIAVIAGLAGLSLPQLKILRK